MVVRRLAHLLLLIVVPVLALPLIAVAQDQRLIAEVDRSSIRANETFNYTLRAEGRFSGRPDLSALGQDFDVLDTFRSTNIQMVNGRTSQVDEWVVALMPRETGTFELPAARLDGVRSNTVTVEVLPASAEDRQSEDIFIEVELDRLSGYEQSQIVYTLRLFVGIGTGPATLTVPLIDGGEAIVEKLGSDREYRTIRGGNVFNVRERSYAIFPQAPGSLSIGPVVYEAVVQQSRGLARTFRLPSDVLTLEVLPAVPRPPEYPDAVWLPASNLTLSESWSDSASEFEQGVPQTRTLTVSAAGLLETQLPEISFEASSALRQYPDQPDLSREVNSGGIIASRTERYAVIAQQAGTVEMPAVELPWWNVDLERWEVARIEARSIDVRASQTADAPATPLPQSQTIEIVEQDPGFWPWLSAVFGAGWLLTVVAWLLRSRRTANEPRRQAEERPVSSRQLLRQLVAACRVDDASRSRELLLSWAARQFADDPPKNLGALSGRLSGPLATEVAALEAALYGPGAAGWNGERLAGLLQQTQAVGQKGGNDDKDPLVPLYR